MHVHCSMTLAPGQAQDHVSELLVRSLPMIKKLGWTLAGSYRVLNGPTRTILNFWDIPDANTAAVAWATQHGFTKQRAWTRMSLGQNTAANNPQQQFALAGPEVG